MSTIRYFDNIPHINYSGMTNEAKEVCSIRFWRCGTRFIIDVAADDVRDTPFYGKWKPLLAERKPQGQSIHEFLEQFNQLCDIVIAQSMEKLRELAPERECWTTIGEYLRTASYRMKLVRGDGEGAVGAVVTEGPGMEPAYRFQPQSMDAIGTVPDDIPRFSSDTITPVNPDTDWRVPPGKVKNGADEQLLFFKACESSMMSADTGEEINDALRSIKGYLAVHARCKQLGKNYPAGLPQVKGIVVSGERLVAGILLSWIPGGKTLDEILQGTDQPRAAEMLQRSEAWKAHVEGSVKLLHECNLYCGSVEDGSFINGVNVVVDGNGQAYLTLAGISSMNDEEAVRCKKQDDSAIQRLFEQFSRTQVP